MVEIVRDQGFSSVFYSNYETGRPYFHMKANGMMVAFMTLRVKLIKFFEANPVLWDNNSGKVGKTAKSKTTCRLVETFDE